MGNADLIHEAYLAWDQYEALRDQRQTQKMWMRGVALKSCRRAIERAVHAAPHFDDGHVFLARILVDEGRFEAAAESLARAQRPNSTHEEAARVRVDLERRRRERIPGLFGRIINWVTTNPTL